MKRFILVLAVSFLSGNNLFAQGQTNLKSPDGRISFTMFIEHGDLYFNTRYRTREVVGNSPYQLILDNRKISGDLKIIKSENYRQDNTFEILGGHHTARNHFNGSNITVNHGRYDFLIDIRVFNDGIAFRTICPGDPGVSRIPDEATSFKVPKDAILWYHGPNMHYEDVYTRDVVADLIPGTWVMPPATFKLKEGIYAAVTEANLIDYSGMALQADKENGLQVRLAHHQPTSYPYKLRYSPEDTLRLSKPASIKGTITTPWRVVIIGSDLNAMVNNDIVNNLCPPPDPTLFPNGIHTSWIKPGRAVWKYLDGGGDGTLEVMKHFTDGGARLGFEHNILEGFWSRWPEASLRDLVDYSAKKAVGIWVWKHSKELRDPVARESFFKLCQRNGVTGAKIDFFDHEAKEVIDLYAALLKEAAKYHILLDFHGANKPTGLAVTYPNELVTEAVKGMEASKLEDRATHETTIPFTRWLAGPAEYTVVHFGIRKKNTTWAHQVASAAILNAPLLTYAAHPDSMLANPAVEIIRSIPSIWDETIVLPPSEIGESAIFARRKGDTWFLAIMNGNQSRKLKVPLSFLKGNYQALIARDVRGNSSAIKMETGKFKGRSSIEINLEAGGGYIARFTK
jgi:alpha-glucosidase